MCTDTTGNRRRGHEALQTQVLWDRRNRPRLVLQAPCAPWAPCHLGLTLCGGLRWAWTGWHGNQGPHLSLFSSIALSQESQRNQRSKRFLIKQRKQAVAGGTSTLQRGQHERRGGPVLGREGRGALHSWWERRLVPPLGKLSGKTYSRSCPHANP